jgi:predicted DNA-binding protein
MQATEKAITFRVPGDLKEKFRAAAEAENRSIAGSLRNLMEKRVAEFEGEEHLPAAGKAA